MKILVTGATGAVGPALVKHLLEQKEDVRILVRDPGSGFFSRKVEVVHGDIKDPDAIERAVEGVDIVFHLAGMLHINDPDPMLGQEYHLVNVEGTRNLAEAAGLAGVKRLMLFSTVSVYGPGRPGMIFHETSEARPCGIYAETKLMAERSVENILNREGRHLVTVLRLGSVYGGNMRGNYPRLLRAVRGGWFIPVGRGENRRTMVCDLDVARLSYLAAVNEGAAGRVYNLTGGNYTFKEILDSMSRVFHLPPPKLYLPERPLRFMLKAAAAISGRIGIRLPVNVSTVEKITEDVAACGDMLIRQIGCSPKYDLVTGWLMPEYLKQHGREN